MNSYSVAERINSEVNSSITYMTDWQQYGLPEYFNTVRTGGFEDCDGYALTKRAKLFDAGWPYEKQMLCTCSVNGQGHMVHAVETDDGWFILDNNYPYPMDPKSLPYTWVSCLKEGEWCALSWS